MTLHHLAVLWQQQHFVHIGIVNVDLRRVSTHGSKDFFIFNSFV